MLHSECKDVTDFDKGLRDLRVDMFASMYRANGVSLAANQIGVDLKIFVYDCPNTLEKDASWRLDVVCNPRLVKAHGQGDEVNIGNEGCLSVPGGHTEVSRPDYAEIVGQELEGNPIKCAAGTSSPACSSMKLIICTVTSSSTGSPRRNGRMRWRGWRRAHRVIQRSRTEA